MGDLTIVTLCQALANITHNRCVLVENSNTCRCVDDIMGPKPITVVNTAPDIMLSEVILIFFVLGLWLSAIGFCLNQYKSLRRLETQVHYCVSRKDPLNIGDIKIVAREQDSIIYKKKRYSTALDTHVTNEELKAMQYVKEYLPRASTIPTPGSSILAALVFSPEDLTTNVPLSTTATSSYNSLGHLTSSPYIPLSTHSELVEEQPPSPPLPPTSAPPTSLASFVLFETNNKKSNGRTSYVHRLGSGRLSAGLVVPHVSTPSSLRSSWAGSHIYEASCSAQHLSVPSNSLRSNRHSDGNISLPVPQTPQNNSENPDEHLLDPRRISNTVRRSLLALHRESQDNIHMHRSKEKTQSENDVFGAFTPWKIKMKSKLKRTHHHHTQPRSHSNTLSILPLQHNSNDQERRISDYATKNFEQRFSTPPSRNYVATNPTLRRSLKYCQKYSTQSTTESETTQGELPMITSIYVSAEDDELAKTSAPTSLT